MLLLATACGTTVGVRTGAPVSLGAPLGQRPPGTEVTGPGSLPVSEQPGLAGGGLPASATSAPAPASVATSTAVRLSRAPLLVGVQTQQGADTFVGSLGLAASFGDTTAQARAAIDEVNRTGGIAGRRVVPVFHVNNPTSSDPATTQDQGTCAAWTQDAHVEVALTLFSTTEVLHGCMQRAHVPLLAATTRDSAYAQQFSPSLLFPFDPALDRWAPAHVERLVANGFFGAKPVIGLIRYDRPDITRAVERGLLPALRRHGLSIARDVQISTPNGASDAGGTVGQIASAVLSMRAAGVTHVLDVLDGGGTILFFMQAAERQGYRPRYGLTTFDAPAAALQGTAPVEQLRNAIGDGWVPAWDVDAAHAPGLSPSGTRCMAAMKRAGQDMTSALARQVALRLCDTLFLLQAALPAGSPLSDTTLAHALAHVTYQPGLTFRTAFTGGRADGVGYLRDLRFDEVCACFRYSATGTSL